MNKVKNKVLYISRFTALDTFFRFTILIVTRNNVSSLYVKNKNMNLIEEKEKLVELRKQLIVERKTLMGKMTEEGENVGEDRRYAFEYLDETIKALSNVIMCIYHADVFINKIGQEKKTV